MWNVFTNKIHVIFETFLSIIFSYVPFFVSWQWPRHGAKSRFVHLNEFVIMSENFNSESSDQFSWNIFVSVELICKRNATCYTDLHEFLPKQVVYTFHSEFSVRGAWLSCHLKDLDSLCKWSEDWLLGFHPQNWAVMRLGNNPEEHKYTMTATTNGQLTRHELHETEAEKDLGVVVDKKLTFKNHVAQATAKANRTLGVVRR